MNDTNKLKKNSKARPKRKMSYYDDHGIEHSSRGAISDEGRQDFSFFKTPSGDPRSDVISSPEGLMSITNNQYLTTATSRNHARSQSANGNIDSTYMNRRQSVADEIICILTSLNCITQLANRLVESAPQTRSAGLCKSRQVCSPHAVQHRDLDMWNLRRPGSNLVLHSILAEFHLDLNALLGIACVIKRFDLHASVDHSSPMVPNDDDPPFPTSNTNNPLVVVSYSAGSGEPASPTSGLREVGTNIGTVDDYTADVKCHLMDGRDHEVAVSHDTDMTMRHMSLTCRENYVWGMAQISHFIEELIAMSKELYVICRSNMQMRKVLCDGAGQQQKELAVYIEQNKKLRRYLFLTNEKYKELETKFVSSGEQLKTTRDALHDVRANFEKLETEHHNLLTDRDNSTTNCDKIMAELNDSIARLETEKTDLNRELALLGAQVEVISGEYEQCKLRDKERVHHASAHCLLSEEINKQRNSLLVEELGKKCKEQESLISKLEDENTRLLVSVRGLEETINDQSHNLTVSERSIDIGKALLEEAYEQKLREYEENIRNLDKECAELRAQLNLKQEPLLTLGSVVAHHSIHHEKGPGKEPPGHSPPRKESDAIGPKVASAEDTTKMAHVELALEKLIADFPDFKTSDSEAKKYVASKIEDLAEELDSTEKENALLSEQVKFLKKELKRMESAESATGSDTMTSHARGDIINFILGTASDKGALLEKVTNYLQPDSQELKELVGFSKSNTCGPSSDDPRPSPQSSSGVWTRIGRWIF